jgi:hypothetical protein
MIKKKKLIKTTTGNVFLTSAVLPEQIGSRRQPPTVSCRHPVLQRLAGIHIGPGMIDNLVNSDKTKINYLSSSRINISNKVNPRKSGQTAIDR